jgi:hypothetical protein
VTYPLPEAQPHTALKPDLKATGKPTGPSFAEAIRPSGGSGLVKIAQALPIDTQSKHASKSRVLA